MNSGYYAAVTGLVARLQAFEVAANNVANLSTPGYKGQREFYSLLTSGDNEFDFPLQRAVNNFAVLGGASVDLREGSLDHTDNPLDLAVEGPGFLEIETPAGTRYTRNGNFSLSATGQLITQKGNPVMGEQGPIDIPAGAASVSPDGTISVGGAVVARLRLVEFPAGTQLIPEGGSNFSVPAGVGREAVQSHLRQGALEASNVNPAAGAIALMTLQRHIETLQRALTIFHTEFNRTAVEDLSRV